MSYKNITHAERKRVYTEGRQAFEEHKRRGYNPHAASNLTLAISWWHGWDTAEEEGIGEKTPPAKHDKPLKKPAPQNQTAEYDRSPEAA